MRCSRMSCGSLDASTLPLDVEVARAARSARETAIDEFIPSPTYSERRLAASRGRQHPAVGDQQARHLRHAPARERRPAVPAARTATAARRARTRERVRRDRDRARASDRRDARRCADQHPLGIAACRARNDHDAEDQRADDRADRVRRVDAADQAARILARSPPTAASASGKLAPHRNAAGRTAQQTRTRSSWKVNHGLGDSDGLIGQ